MGRGISGVPSRVSVSQAQPSQVPSWAGFMGTCALSFQVQWLVWDCIIRDIRCKQCDSWNARQVKFCSSITSHKTFCRALTRPGCQLGRHL